MLTKSETFYLESLFHRLGRLIKKNNFDYLANRVQINTFWDIVQRDNNVVQLDDEINWINGSIQIGPRNRYFITGWLMKIKKHL